MHYDSKYNTKKRGADVDLFDRDTRIQSAPVAQYIATRRLDDRVPPAKALMGYDAERLVLEGYNWVAGG
jgi:hypothetical protein